MKKKTLILLALVFAGTVAGLRAESADPRVKVLLEEALKLYSERQYVRSLDLFKQVQRIEPDNATAEEYIKSSEQRILEWESQGGEKPDKKSEATWDSLLGRKKADKEVTANANDIIAARRSLVEKMRNRASNTDNIVKIEESKGGMNVVLFHDQLFVPGLQILRDEALPILENVAMIIRSKGDREVTLISQAHTDSNDPYMLYPEVSDGSGDASLPQMKGGSGSFFQDIEAIRSMVLFTYIAQRSMGRTPSAANQ